MSQNTTYPHGGQLVRCIRDGWPIKGLPRYRACIFPIQNQILTIRKIVNLPDGVRLRFFEIVNPPLLFLDGKIEIAFWIECFVPLDDLTEFEKREERRPLDERRDYDNGVPVRVLLSRLGLWK